MSMKENKVSWSKGMTAGRLRCHKRKDDELTARPSEYSSSNHCWLQTRSYVKSCLLSAHHEIQEDVMVLKSCVFDTSPKGVIQYQNRRSRHSTPNAQCCPFRPTSRTQKRPTCARAVTLNNRRRISEIEPSPQYPCSSNASILHPRLLLSCPDVRIVHL